MYISQVQLFFLVLAHLVFYLYQQWEEFIIVDLQHQQMNLDLGWLQFIPSHIVREIIFIEHLEASKKYLLIKLIYSHPHLNPTSKKFLQAIFSSFIHKLSWTYQMI